MLKDQATGRGPSGDPPLAEGFPLVLLPGDRAGPETFRGSDEGALFPRDSSCGVLPT